MCSTPPPIDDVVDAGGDERRGEVHRLLGGAALAVDGGGGRLDRQPGLEPGVAADVDALLAELLHAAGDDVLDLGGVDPGAVDQLGVGLREQRGGVDVLVVALLLVPAADRGADRLDDDDLAALELPVAGHPEMPPRSRLRDETIASREWPRDSVDAGRRPARPVEDDPELVAPARGALHVVPHRDVLVERDPHRAEGPELGGEPVADPLALGLVGAEQLVPDDQDPGVVAVEVLLVDAVVDAVVRRRVEDRLERRAAACGSARCGSRTGRSATTPGRAAPSTARSRPAAARARTGSRSSAPRSGGARSRGCSAGRSGGRRGSPRTGGSRARRGGTSSRRSRRRRTGAPRPTSRRGRGAAASARRATVYGGEDRELPDRVDRDVAEPHREARPGVARLEPDQVVVVVVPRCRNERYSSDEQQDEERDRVVEDLGHRRAAGYLELTDRSAGSCRWFRRSCPRARGAPSPGTSARRSPPPGPGRRRAGRSTRRLRRCRRAAPVTTSPIAAPMTTAVRPTAFAAARTRVGNSSERYGASAAPPAELSIAARKNRIQSQAPVGQVEPDVGERPGQQQRDPNALARAEVGQPAADDQHREARGSGDRQEGDDLERREAMDVVEVAVQELDARRGEGRREETGGSDEQDPAPVERDRATRGSGAARRRARGSAATRRAAGPRGPRAAGRAAGARTPRRTRPRPPRRSAGRRRPAPARPRSPGAPGRAWSPGSPPARSRPRSPPARSRARYRRSAGRRGRRCRRRTTAPARSRRPAGSGRPRRRARSADGRCDRPTSARRSASTIPTRTTASPVPSAESPTS